MVFFTDGFIFISEQTSPSVDQPSSSVNEQLGESEEAERKILFFR